MAGEGDPYFSPFPHTPTHTHTHNRHTVPTYVLVGDDPEGVLIMAYIAVQQALTENSQHQGVLHAIYLLGRDG